MGNLNSEVEYAKQLLKTGRLSESAIRQAIQALQLEQSSVGLDAACGIGTHTIQLGEAVGPGGKVTGLDISPGFLDFARKTAQQSGMSERLDFQQGDMLDLPFDDNAFDWVWCNYGQHRPAVHSGPAGSGFGAGHSPGCNGWALPRLAGCPAGASGGAAV